MPHRLVLAVSLLAVCGATAMVSRADGPEAPPTTWVYDVHVVRVDLRDPEAAGLAPWPGPDATAVTTPWPDLLRSLKERGRTTILCSQRVTGFGGGPTVVAADRRTTPRIIVNSVNGGIVSSTLGSFSEGASVELGTDVNGLEYSVRAEWLLPEVSAGAGPVSATAQWKGTHGLLRGQALLLRHAQQHESAPDARSGVEVHVVIVGRAAGN